MDQRLEKFAFSEDEILAVEMAITRMVAKDVGDHKDSKTLKHRSALLRKRLANGEMAEYQDLVRPDGSGTNKLKQALERDVVTTLEQMSPLHRVLFLIEVHTASPYAAATDEEAKKLTVGEKARKDSLRRLIRAASPLGALKNQEKLLAEIESAQERAEGVHSKFWSKLGKFLISAAAATAAGIFAGPVIGGLVGHFVLGLSGAAAVSAGLALLGGGALAAGGFGMLGGSVVVAAAFGAAGAGASTMFMGEGGPEAARVAFTRHHMAFELLRQLKLLDHQLASDFLESVADQLEHYRELGASKTTEKADAKRAREVVDVIDAVERAMKESYGEATKNGEVLNQPVAWQPERVGEAVEDADFAGLVDQMTSRQNTLENCLWVLENARGSFGEVVDSPRFGALRPLLGDRLTHSVSDGIAFVAEATRLVAELAKSQEDEMAQLAEALRKVEALQDEVEERGHLLERYQRTAVRMTEAIKRLREERDALQQELAQALEAQQQAAAAALLAGAALAARGASDRPQLGKGEQPRTGEALSTAHGSPRHGQLDVMLAVLLGGVAADSPRSRGELERIMDDFDLPLGASPEEVRKRRRALLAEVHTDRIDDAPEAIKRAARQAKENYELAAELHHRYGSLLEPAE